MQQKIIKPVFTLAKRERLKSRKLLDQLFREGTTFFIHPFKVYYRSKELPEDIFLQAGFGASARSFRKAVDRNRIKRLMREAYRLQKTGLQELLTASGNRLVVFFLYVGKEVPPYDMVKEKMAAVLHKLGKQF